MKSLKKFNQRYRRDKKGQGPVSAGNVSQEDVVAPTQIAPVGGGTIGGASTTEIASHSAPLKLSQNCSVN